MRIGVYICHCGSNIAGVLDIDYLKNYAEKLDNVVTVKDIQFACGNSGQEQITKDIIEQHLDSVVIAACSPRLHEVTFRRTLQKAGLNPYMLEMVNIREQCSWVHENGTTKAATLIAMGVAKASLLSPLAIKSQPVKNEVLVIGAGVAGIQAALDLADSGIKVHLVEKEPTIGGKMALMNEVFPTNDCSMCVLAPKMSDVQNNPHIDLLTYSEITDISGHVGDFKVSGIKKARFVDPEKCKGCIDICAKVCPVVTPNQFDFGIGTRKAIYLPIRQAVPQVAVIDPEHCVGCNLCKLACPADAVDFSQKEEKFEFNVGAIIVATGWQPFDAARKEEYGYKRYRDVITSLELERMLNASGPTHGRVIRPSTSSDIKSVAFIQCVGSRDEQVGNAYCSKVCCMASIKNASLIKEKYPDASVAVHYIDIRAGGEMYEEYYRKAQEAGVVFIRGRVAQVMQVTQATQLTEDKNKIAIRYEDTFSGEMAQTSYDLIVLAVGIEPEKEADPLGRMLNLAKREDGFYQVAHPKMRPVETHKKGVFLAGCASGPKEIQLSIAQGSAAASKAGNLVSKGRLDIEPLNAYVQEELCDGCRLCEQVCDLKRVKVTERVARVDETACRGCGACSAACHTGAMQVHGYTDAQVLAQVKAATSEINESPLIIGFLCNWCSYAAADLAGSSRIVYPSNIRIIRLPCAGRVNPVFVLEALSGGADGVLVAGCRPGECHYIFGNQRAMKRMNALRDMLKDSGFNENRLRTEWISASEGERFSDIVKDFVKKLAVMGPVGSEIGSSPILT